MTESGARLLAANILKRAELDYNRDKNKRSPIARFAKTEWCDDLCELARFNYEEYKKKVTK